MTPARAALIAGVTGGVAALVLVATWATYPWTKDQCLRWAAERASDRRANLALDVCEERFGPLFKSSQR